MLLLRGATAPRVAFKRDLTFQYMLLLRGATRSRAFSSRIDCFNTCSSCEEQQGPLAPARNLHSVSIHAPLARSNSTPMPPHDTGTCFNTCSSCEEQHGEFICVFALQCFNTCSSCEEQRGINHELLQTCFVSIHAPLARSNSISRFLSSASVSFNTCSSCEEQLDALEKAIKGV